MSDQPDAPRIYPFNEIFLTEPASTAAGGSRLECPGPPDRFTVAPDAAHNYEGLHHNQENGYGLTGLITMEQDEIGCYGRVQPGTIFLFPGIDGRNGPVPPYYGNLPLLECSTQQPLVLTSTSPPLHQQMADLLDVSAGVFIGFSIASTSLSGVGWNSGTCNYNWFEQRSIPPRCPDSSSGYLWQYYIENALTYYLGMH